MANVRIKDLTTTAATTASDDFFGVDGATNGTRKLNAYSPTFGGNLTASGTIRFDGQLLCGNAGGIQIRSAAGDANLVDVSGGRNLTMSGAATFGGNLTVSGTGNSSVAGTLLVATTTNSSNGKLQLADHTTSAGGIGFGTDTSWYRSQGGVLTLDTSANFQGFEAKKNGTTNLNFYSNSSDAFIGYKGTGSLTIQTLTGSPALTLDSSQNATFAGNIKTAAPSGGTAATWRLGTVATVSPTSPNRTIEVEIGGTTYYIHAKTTND